MEEPTFIVVPCLQCKHPNTRAEDVDCPWIVLPYPNLKAMTDEEFDAELEATLEEEIHLLDWPGDGWQAFVGCSECGFVSLYTGIDVLWRYLPKSAPGRYHSGADCFCIEFQCGQKSCKAPTKLHVQKSGLTENGVLDLLRRPFFIGSLPCGHDVPSLPLNQYQIHKVMDPIG